MFQDIFSPGACWWGAAASTQLSVLRAEFLHPGLGVRPEPEACSPMWGQGDPREVRAGVLPASVGSGTVCPLLPISVQMKRNCVKNNNEAEKEV